MDTNSELIIRAQVHAKEITLDGSPFIVCNNDNYKLQFEFDPEWEALTIKTARFIAVAGKTSTPSDVVFTGNECPIPKVIGIDMLYVGLFSGEAKATCKVSIPCRKSILCDTPVIPPPEPDCYAQILALFENVHGANAWVRFSANADGSGFTEEWDESKKYVGFATSVTPPTEKEAFVWTYITSGPKGNKGDKGDKGDPGNTPFIGANGNWWIGSVDTGVLANASSGASAEHKHSADDITQGILSVERGGTGGSSVESARSHLGVYGTKEVDDKLKEKSDVWREEVIEGASVTLNVADKTEYRCPNAKNVTIHCPEGQSKYECWIFIGGEDASFTIFNATKVGTAERYQYNHITGTEISIKDGRYVVGYSGESVY